jgi:hypothetical protein
LSASRSCRPNQRHRQQASEVVVHIYLIGSRQARAGRRDRTPPPLHLWDRGRRLLGICSNPKSFSSAAQFAATPLLSLPAGSESVATVPPSPA